MRRVIFAFAVAALSLSAPTNLFAQDILSAIYRPTPIANWTGFYVGGNFGYGWTKVNSSAQSALGSSASSFTMKGMIAGGQLGVNVQTGMWVFGIESDVQASWQKLHGPGNTANLNSSVGVGGTPIDETDSLNWFGTTRARLGVAEGPVFIYGTGGLAYATIRTQASSSGISIIKGSPFKFGWVAGGGIEAMMTRNWTMKVEYLHLDFGGYTDPYVYLGTAPPTPADLHQRITDDIVRVGVNYLFK